MSLKSILQLVIFGIILIILISFYYTFLSKKDDYSLNENQNTEVMENKENFNKMTNIEYNSVDSNGNEYYLNAERVLIDLENENKNMLKLEGVISIINFKNRGIAYIYANNAVYNEKNHDTAFYNKVKMEYLNHKIFSDNLDLLFSENVSLIYNEVRYESNNSKLNTDKISIDMKNGDIKLQMENENKKVKLVTKYESIN